MKFRVVNLAAMNKNDLVYHPMPINNWPVCAIDVEANKEVTCIASWRWDVNSSDELSNNLSECVWDALSLGFRYMLTDIVSLDQDTENLSAQLIEYSRLYRELHCVMSYHADEEVKRPWITYEALRILESPTYLGYICHKWRLRVPLISSLLIRQVVTRRLGVVEFNERNLHRCDTEEAEFLRIYELKLLDGIDLSRKLKTIILDRRQQTYASDHLLVYELSLPESRNVLIEMLRIMESNSVAVPALFVIWAMTEGFSLGIRGCDWEVKSVIHWTIRIIKEAMCSANLSAEINYHESTGEIVFEGTLTGTVKMEVQIPSGRLAMIHKETDLLVRCRDNRITFSKDILVEDFLRACSIQAAILLMKGEIGEPPPLTEDHPQYTLEFEDNDYHG